MKAHTPCLCGAVLAATVGYGQQTLPSTFVDCATNASNPSLTCTLNPPTSPNTFWLCAGIRRDADLKGSRRCSLKEREGLGLDTNLGMARLSGVSNGSQ